MQTIVGLREVLVYQLKRLYSAESQLTQAMPGVIPLISNAKAQSSMAAHLLETKVQLSRLEQIQKLLEVSLLGETCEVMRGLLIELSELKAIETPTALMDTLLLSECQRVEHLERAMYSGTRSIAEALDLREIAVLLTESLLEERQAGLAIAAVLVGEVLPRAQNMKPL